MLALLRQHEAILIERFGVRQIGIFGSFIRGEERPESNVDVLVIFRKDNGNLRSLYGLQVLSRRSLWQDGGPWN